jgi:Ni,Fe-hydrogenase III component G
MTTLEKIKEQFGGQIEVWEKSPRRVYLTVPNATAKALVRCLFQEQGARFSIATGVDTRLGVEILYHLALDQEGVMISVRTLVAKPELVMESFTDFLPAVNWIEREIHEMLGVNFTGHPNLERLLLPDDWPIGVYPLQRENNLG